MSEHRARKRFGQNFLHDPHVIDNIIDAISPQIEDNLIEIGPGLGALTELLIKTAKKLQVIELDRDLIPKLEDFLSSAGKLIIHEADALKFDFSKLSQTNHDLRLVGNLPYNISTPLIFHLLKQIVCIKDMHFMLQKEVVDRMTSSVGDSNYGRLSIMIQHQCTVEKLFEVEPNAFKPAPKVISAIVRLSPHSTPPYPDCDTKQLKKVVTQAFSQRRKTIRNSLQKLATPEQLEQTNINPSSRPQEVDITAYINLSNLLSSNEITDQTSN